jgi:hypothetical protein
MRLLPPKPTKHVLKKHAKFIVNYCHFTLFKTSPDPDQLGTGDYC